ncbi:MAG: galactose-1-phosphate uridylyltransferase [Acidimicrobiales bacterium]
MIAVDPHLGTVVHVVEERQDRPNLPATGCPFCVGGIEAPEPYDVKSFPNRWPAMPDRRCEVVLYTPDHDATFASLGVDGARKVVDLWASRTARLGERDDVEYVLVFENRGAEVGATIAHPHGQIYAFDHVPSRPARRIAAGWEPEADPGERLVRDHAGWRVWVPVAPVYPISLAIAPTERAGDLPSLDDARRTALAEVLVDMFGRLDRVFDQPLPYMWWFNQRPFTDHPRDDDVRPWLNLEIVSPWRAARTPRFIAAAEVGCEEYFNPVDPAELAARLRQIGEGG